MNGGPGIPHSGNRYIFSDEVVKMNFLLQCLDWYLILVVSGNRYLPNGCKGNVLSIAITGNVTVSR